MLGIVYDLFGWNTVWRAVQVELPTRNTQVANQGTHRYFGFHLHTCQNQAFYHFAEIAPLELSLNLISPLSPYNLPC